MTGRELYELIRSHLPYEQITWEQRTPAEQAGYDAAAEALAEEQAEVVYEQTPGAYQ